MGRKPRVPRHTRAADRARVGPLRLNVVAKRTLTFYREACRWFFRRQRARRITLAYEVEHFDEQVMEIIEECWQEGDPRALVANLLSGLRHFVPH